MKKLLTFAITVCMLTSCGLLKNINWDPEQLGQAASAAMTAASITDEQIVLLSQQTVAQLDAQNRLASDKYQKRLANLLSKVNDVEGIKINFKVYQTDEINAFACGDGSIRVYSGLMDVMNDEELMAIIGHECGHVVHQDTKHAMRNAYLAAAARGIISAAGGTLGSLSKSVLGDIGEAYLSSQYSQKQEYAADEYGLKFATAYGFSPYSMANALDKLVQMSNGAQSSRLEQMFASHPDSKVRAERMRQIADQYSKK